jgi:rod shape-determining protein MreC
VTTTYPLKSFFRFATLKVVGVKDFFLSIGNLKTENNELFKNNQRLIAENARLKDAEQENHLLREQLSLLPRDRFEFEGAYVVSQDVFGNNNWLEIGKGSNYGIEIGMPVIVSDGLLVGRVSEVYPRFSRVSLITSPQNIVNAVDLQTEARGVVKGEYGLGMIMDMVLQTDVLTVGDTVVTSGTGKFIPRGLVLGEITDIISSQDGLFQRAILSSSVNFKNLETVFVIKNFN